MAKEEKKNDQVESAVAASKTKGPAAPKLGEDVIYYRNVATTSGSKLTRHAAKIVGFPLKTDNFQEKDLAVNLVVFDVGGVVCDKKSGIMYSEEDMPGRWNRKPHTSAE